MKWIYTTFPDNQTAEKICSQLVSAQLIACANIFPQIKSIYQWDNEIKMQGEVAAFLKTSEAALPQATQMLQSLHPYDCPCVAVLNVESANPKFSEWIKLATNG